MTPLTNRSTARPMVALAALLGLLMLAGCGASTSTSTQDSDTTSQTDAPATTSETSAPAGENGTNSTGECDLWTLDEVSAATGVEVTDTLGTDQPGTSACNYNDADGMVMASYSVLTSDSPAFSPQTGYDAQTEGTEPVAGIGDQAKWVELTTEMGTLLVMSGGNLFSVAVYASELDLQQKKDASIDLAQIAIDRFQ